LCGHHPLDFDTLRYSISAGLAAERAYRDQRMVLVAAPLAFPTVSPKGRSSERSEIFAQQHAAPRKGMRPKYNAPFACRRSRLRWCRQRPVVNYAEPILQCPCHPVLDQGGLHEPASSWLLANSVQRPQVSRTKARAACVRHLPAQRGREPCHDLAADVRRSFQIVHGADEEMDRIMHGVTRAGRKVSRLRQQVTWKRPMTWPSAPFQMWTAL